MAKVITQLDLNEIIKSAASITAAAGIVVSNMALSLVLRSIDMKDIRESVQIVEEILNSQTSIINLMMKMSAARPDPKVIEIFTTFHPKYIEPILDAFTTSMIRISKFGVLMRLRYMWGIHNIVKLTRFTIAKLARLKIPVSQLLSVAGDVWVLTKVTNSVYNVLNSISVMETGFAAVWIARNKVEKLTSAIVQIARTLTKLGRQLSLSVVFMAVIIVRSIFIQKTINALFGIVNAVNKMKLLELWSFNIKAKLFRKAIFNLRRIINAIKTIHIPRISVRSLLRLKLLKFYIAGLVGLMGSLTLAAILMIPFIIASPAIILAFWLVSKIINLLGKVMFNMGTDPKLILGLALTSIILGMLVVIALMMVILISQTKAIVEGVGYLLGFFGILIIVTALLIALGFGLAAIASIAGIAIAGIALTFVMIGLIFLLGLMLLSLQTLKLDKEAIRDSVATVMETAFYVIQTVFESVYTIGGGEDGQPWYKKVISFIGGSIATFISAILSVHILAMSFVAIGLILLLATQLRILQTIELDQDKITTNVKKVIDVALGVVSAVFGGITQTKDSKEDKSWFRSVLEFAGGAIMHIIGAILSVAILAVSIVSIQLILMMAVQLRILQVLDLNPDKIKENVKKVIDAALMVSSAIFDTPDDKEAGGTNKGFIRNVLEVLGAGPILKILDAILSVAFLAMSVVSMLLIFGLAAQLKVLQSIDLDPEKIRNNVTTVIDACHAVISAIMQPDTTEQQEAKGFFRKLLELALPSNLLTMIDALMSIGFLAVSMVAIGMVSTLAKQLTTIAKLPSMDNISAKTAEVISASKRVINAVFSGVDKGEMKKIADEAGVAEQYLKVVQNTINSLNEIVVSATSVAELDANKLKNLGLVSNEVINVINDLTEKIKSKASDTDIRLNQISRLQGMIQFFMNIKEADVIRTQKITDKYIELLDKVGAIDLAKLQTTTNLFEKMAEFSKSISGDFEGLADTLNEKIAPLIEELKGLLEGVQERVEKTGSDISASVYASKAPTLNKEEMADQTAREMPNSSEEERIKETQRRMEAQARRQNNEIVSKLAELIDLFEDGRARVKPVM